MFLPVARSSTMPRYSSRSMGSVFFDQQPLHDAAFGTGLVRDQRHAQNFFGERRGPRAASLATFTPPPLPRPPA